MNEHGHFSPPRPFQSNESTPPVCPPVGLPSCGLPSQVKDQLQLLQEMREDTSNHFFQITFRTYKSRNVNFWLKDVLEEQEGKKEGGAGSEHESKEEGEDMNPERGAFAFILSRTTIQEIIM